MNPLLGSKMSPARFSFCIISSASASVMSLSAADFIMSSAGIVLPTFISSSCIISFIMMSLFLVLAGVSDSLSTSNWPVFSSNATCLRQWSISSIAFFASFLSTLSLNLNFALASDSLTSPSSCLADIGTALTPSPPAVALILR